MPKADPRFQALYVLLLLKAGMDAVFTGYLYEDLATQVVTRQDNTPPYIPLGDSIDDDRTNTPVQLYAPAGCKQRRWCAGGYVVDLPGACRQQKAAPYSPESAPDKHTIWLLMGLIGIILLGACAKDLRWLCLVTGSIGAVTVILMHPPRKRK